MKYVIITYNILPHVSHKSFRSFFLKIERKQLLRKFKNKDILQHNLHHSVDTK